MILIPAYNEAATIERIVSDLGVGYFPARKRICGSTVLRPLETLGRAAA